MKNFILENDPSWEGVPAELKEVLKTRFLDNRIFIYGFGDMMRSHPHAAMVLLDQIQTGDNAIAQTNFHEEDQIESFIHLMAMFMQKKRSINWYTILSEEKFGTLEDVFGSYVQREHAFTTPPGENVYDYKQYMNHLLMVCLSCHKVYRMTPERDILLTFENITRPQKVF